MASTPTTRLAYDKPAVGDRGWGATMNTNLDAIDEDLGTEHKDGGAHGPKVTISQTGNDNVLVVNQTTAATTIVVDILNSGTGDGVFINQDGNGVALDIDSEATGQPLVQLAPINTNTRGDISFGTARTGNPSSPSEGDVWYNSTDNNLYLFDGVTNVDLTAAGGGGGTLDDAYDFGGAGSGRTITVDSGAVELTGAQSATILTINKTDTDAGDVVTIINAGTGDSLVVDTSAFVVEASGQVGIGTANPSTTLQIVGSSSMSGDLTVDGSATISGKLTVTGGVDPDYMQLTPQTEYSHIPESSLYVDANSNNRLYLLDQNKNVYRVILNDELEALEARLTALEAKLGE